MLLFIKNTFYLHKLQEKAQTRSLEYTLKTSLIYYIEQIYYNLLNCCQKNLRKTRAIISFLGLSFKLLRVKEQNDIFGTFVLTVL